MSATPSQSQQPVTQDRRWYDKKPTVKRAFGVLCAFPDDFLTLIAGKVCEMVECRYEANTILSSLKSLGSERILGIYKSKKKLRQLDGNQNLHLMTNYFLVMRPMDQSKAAGETLEMVSITQDYLKACQRYKSKPSQVHIQTLADTYIKSGEPPAREILNRIEDDLHQMHEKVSFEAGDMRIRPKSQ